VGFVAAAPDLLQTHNFGAERGADQKCPMSNSGPFCLNEPTTDPSAQEFVVLP
jgi:hypothetical protein